MLNELSLERLLSERVVATGTVKTVDPERGRGTISPDEGDADLVFDSATPVSVGVRVAFEVDVGHDGLHAYKVTKLPPR
jgi:cold shock CspA family protein